MGTLHMIKNTGNKIKEVTLTLILAASLLGVILSTNANAAAKTTTEIAVSNFVIAQSKIIMTELNKQLQQSIENEINAFSDNYSLNNAAMWWTDEQEIPTKPPSTKKTVNNTDSKQQESN
ncbi:MAG: hypothetical protein V5789_06415 [Colwellia sp.]